MNSREVLFGLHETPGIGWQTIHAVMKLFKCLKELPGLTESQIRELPLPLPQDKKTLAQEKKALIFKGSRAEFIESRLKLYERGGHRFVTRFDVNYPEWLSEIAKPPWILYYDGNYELLDQPVFGVVGTRIPTSYGKRVARQLCAELSENGWHIASGLARGIDSEAHIGALEGRGKTIAVLGSPINVPYPQENARLFERIRGEGLVLTEYPLGTPVRPGMFPERNRIISGISMGVLVVEADEGSGSLITSDYAIKQNREVFAVPGPISSPKSKGTNELIQKGAKLVASVEDIFDEFADRNPEFCPIGKRAPGTKPAEVSLSEDEKKTLSFIGDIPITFDRLYELAQFDFGHLHSVLISLLVKKKIEQQAGSSYTLLY